MSIYDWPELEDGDDYDRAHARWAHAVRLELEPVYEIMNRPLPDDPRILKQVVNDWLDGWMARVAALAVKAEYYLNAAKGTKWPPQITEDGEKLTVADRDSRYDGALAPYRFVRDELNTLLKLMQNRVMWAQSVLKLQEAANY